MKKLWCFRISLLVMGGLVMNCGNPWMKERLDPLFGDDGNPGVYTVSFNSMGGSAVSPILNVPHGTTVSAPASPNNSGYGTFDKWYSNAARTTVFNFSTAITANITLYAGWNAYHALGDTGPGSGRIFYRDEMGFTMTDDNTTAHYLEAAPVDQSTGAQWGANGIQISGVTTFTSAISDPLASKIGNGREDTQLIFTYLAGTAETGRAVQLCKAYSGGGLTDWFLPSYGELYQLYLNRGSIGISINGSYYWSSSQYNNNVSIWSYEFSAGNPWYVLKTNSNYVRAIRAF
jgi:uncharacterized repeat protein (TIGR02543 family)